MLHGHSQDVDSSASAAVMGLEQAYMLQRPHALRPSPCQIAALCGCAHLQACVKHDVSLRLFYYAHQA